MEEKIKIIIKKTGKIILALAVVFGLYYFFENTLNYFDPISSCKINITADPLGGNRSTIREALGLLKTNDQESYKNVCKYVDSIEERYCDLKHIQSPADAPWHKAEGCYVKGEKTIYLKPHEDESGIMISQRAELIKKFAEDSKIFWQNY